jgi:hypothetical protein
MDGARDDGWLCGQTIGQLHCLFQCLRATCDVRVRSAACHQAPAPASPLPAASAALRCPRCWMVEWATNRAVLLFQCLRAICRRAQL